MTESWMDSRGNMYCTVDWMYGVISGAQELWRLDESGNKFEANFKYGLGGEYPTKIDPNPDPMEELYYNVYTLLLLFLEMIWP